MQCVLTDRSRCLFFKEGVSLRKAFIQGSVYSEEAKKFWKLPWSCSHSWHRPSRWTWRMSQLLFRREFSFLSLRGNDACARCGRPSSAIIPGLISQEPLTQGHTTQIFITQKSRKTQHNKQHNLKHTFHLAIHRLSSWKTVSIIK